MQNYSLEIDPYLEGNSDIPQDFTETYAPVFEVCDWISEAELSNDTTFAALSELFVEVVENFLYKKRRRTYWLRQITMQKHCKELSKTLKQEWERKKDLP